ncbi:hypothetical protein [Paracidovorax avenae]|uniref:hypothetical protein n=1 Tax=Paracidovorax avenae TaxID=80867 RepID=UPI001AD81203|nr:hypothetical protein [Paracidovorax avenae]
MTLSHCTISPDHLLDPRDLPGKGAHPHDGEYGKADGLGRQLDLGMLVPCHEQIPIDMVHFKKLGKNKNF